MHQNRQSRISTLAERAELGKVHFSVANQGLIDTLALGCVIKANKDGPYVYHLTYGSRGS